MMGMSSAAKQMHQADKTGWTTVFTDKSPDFTSLTNPLYNSAYYWCVQPDPLVSTGELWWVWFSIYGMDVC